MRHIAFPSIEQYRNAVTDITLRSTYIGDATDGTPLYDETKPKPTLTFTGSVKLHGTNASVCYHPEVGLWAQSRETVLTPTQDNAGFARWVAANHAALEPLLQALTEANGIVFGPETVLTLFGEWAGLGIQAGVGIAQLPKAFYIFAASFSPSGDEANIWLVSANLRDHKHRIFNVEDYATWQIVIDFNAPQAAQAELTTLTEAVEAECPIAKALGVSGVGEGIVWRADYDGVRTLFKVKGEKHSVSKVKEIAAVAPETLASIEQFVTYAVTENRFRQALTVVFSDPAKADVKRLGDVIKWMNQDIQKEEADTLQASGLTWKEVSGPIAARTRALLFALPV